MSVLEHMGIVALDKKELNPTSASRLLVTSASPIYGHMPKDSEPDLSGSTNTAFKIVHLASDFLATRLFGYVQHYTSIVQGLNYFKPPCMAFTLTRQCPDRDKCVQEHILGDQEKTFEARLSKLSKQLELVPTIRWLEGRLSQRTYESSECKMMVRKLLDLVWYVTARRRPVGTFFAPLMFGWPDPQLLSASW